MSRKGVKGGCVGEDLQGRVCREGCGSGTCTCIYAIDVSVGERQRKCVLTAGFQIHHSS